MAKPQPVRDALLAVSLLTIVPTGARWPADGDTQVAAWFPLVGLAIGAIGYALAHAASVFDAQVRAPYVVAAVIVIVWALLTRGLHWDGLADVADGYWGSEDQTRRLEIMADSATGAFGTAAVALAAILEVAALGAIVSTPHELPLLIIPVVGRCSATAAAWLGTPARPGGLGASVMRRPGAGAVVIALIPLAFALGCMWWAFGVFGLAFVAGGLVLALATPHLLAKRFGGVTGDVMGASVLVTEILLFATFALLG